MGLLTLGDDNVKRAILIAVCAAAVAFGSVGCSSEPAGPSAIEQVNEKLRSGSVVDAVKIAKESGDKEAIAQAEAAEMLYRAKEDLAKMAAEFDPIKRGDAYSGMFPGLASSKIGSILSDAERLSGNLAALKPPTALEGVHRDITTNVELIRDTSAKQMAILRKYGVDRTKMISVDEALVLNEAREPELRALYEIVRSAKGKLDSQFLASLKNL